MISLREHVKGSVGSFLYGESFPTNIDMPDCIMSMLDMISDYSEEGKVLFPELVITNNIDVIIKTVPSSHIHINEVEFSVTAFQKALKQCAPLAGGDWTIYINFNDRLMSYGLITTELSETSITLQRQLINVGVEPLTGVSLAFIKRKGIKRVELQGFKNTVVINFSLKNTSETSDNCVHELCKAFLFPESNAIFTDYFEKIISRSLKESHGALIGIVNDEQISVLKQKVPDGIYLREPIDLVNLLLMQEDAGSHFASSSSLRLSAKAVQGMICSDGITVISTSGKVVGYNLFIDKSSYNIVSTELTGIAYEKTEKTVGGSRTRAYNHMVECGCFKAAFFKSQDGEEKITTL